MSFYPLCHLLVLCLTLHHDFSQLAYLPDRRKENMADDNARSTASEHFKEPRAGTSSLDEMTKDRKKNKSRGGMLGWLKLKVSSTLLRTILFKIIRNILHVNHFRLLRQI